MKLKSKAGIGLFLFLSSFSFGQFSAYNYKRELKGIHEQWHQILLPDVLFSKINKDMSDIRIYSITESNDTIETPYIFNLAKEQEINHEVSFNLVNRSYNEKGYYFTFEILSEEAINQIKLDFESQNFDWRLNLEGSQDQKEWFTLIEDYRILSIKNKLSEFKFTDLIFPNSKYRFYRLFISSKEEPKLNFAKLIEHECIKGKLKNFPIEKMSTSADKEGQQTEIDIFLPLAVPLSMLEIAIKDTFDYYRPLTIKYLVDSFETEQGWKYNYQTLKRGTLNSIERNEFKFNSTILRRLKILIDNGDNQALELDTVEVKGYEHVLTGRFTEKGTYYLVYGNENERAAHYDIELFKDKIPKTMNEITLGEEEIIIKESTLIKEALFKNKKWLWAIMIFVIVLLGGFSLKMMAKK